VRTTDGDAWTPQRPPNHVYKRGLFVEAAKSVMRSDGLSACTVRRIARETEYSAGTIHYYFEDINELIDFAYLELTQDYVDIIRPEDDSEPIAAFWETVGAYLAPFVEHPSVATLWFDFTAARSFGRRSETLRASIDCVRTLFRERLAAVERTIADSEEPLVSYLLGQLLMLASGPISSAEIAIAIERITGIAAPAGFDLLSPCAICELDRLPAKVAEIVWN